MKLTDIFKKSSKMKSTNKATIKIDKKKLAQITGGVSYIIDNTKSASDASAGKGTSSL